MDRKLSRADTKVRDYMKCDGRSMVRRAAVVGLATFCSLAISSCASSGQRYKTPGLREECYLPSTRELPDYPGKAGTSPIGLSDLF